LIGCCIVFVSGAIDTAAAMLGAARENGMIVSSDRTNELIKQAS
jgi:hypothetical protein